MDDMIRYIAAYGNGSWGAEGKTHAVDAATGEPLPYRKHDIRFSSLCGQRYLQPQAPERDFANVMQFEQCQRCAKIAAKRNAA